MEELLLIAFAVLLAYAVTRPSRRQHDTHSTGRIFSFGWGQPTPRRHQPANKGFFGNIFGSNQNHNRTTEGRAHSTQKGHIPFFK